MATVLLGSVGGAIGGLFGGPLGATIGHALGGWAGSFLDQQIVNALTPPTKREGPRLATTDVQTSTEGSVINRLIGRSRLTGQIIWATRFEEQAVTQTSGGKGSTGPQTITTEYRYFGNFAVGLCEGAVQRIGRIFADGKEIDQTLYTIRKYLGTATQPTDPLLEAKEGAAPAYRGLCYLVFEHLPLADWGNRLPQLSVEVHHAVGALERQVQGVAIIGGNEFGFDTKPVKRTGTAGGEALNRHTLVAGTDFEASVTALLDLAPNVKSAMLVVPWFGSDLRAGQCTIRAKVDDGTKTTDVAWSVEGLARGDVPVISTVNGKAAYGGTPTDQSVLAAIALLKARGVAVTLCPFIMMDVAQANSLPNPYSANAAAAGQPAYPWRGRVTVSPAAGFAGSVDKTAAATAQVAAFVGTAAPAHFSSNGGAIAYAGPAEWSYRRFILHYAKLAGLAGGVEAFLIGSEMIGLTQARSGAATYPFVDALKTLAADARTLLGTGPKIGYAADWSEYHSHRPADGSNDVYFNLDPLWADANIGFVGIDFYPPLADWRDGSAHLDFAAAGPTTIYDPTYLNANVEGGENYAWFYASDAARRAQTRTPISDGAYGKPWVFRQKDIRNWWLNAHFNRPGGVQSGGATGWTAQSKPVRLMEMGCPAVDKGANQPNVFPDPKSAESASPHFSSGARDDAMQRATLSAILGHYADPANNPVSSVYGAPMLDLTRSHAWCWDARPWPSFALDGGWGDADNWLTGHWLSGRLGAAPGSETIAALLDGAKFTRYAIEPLPTVVDGLTINNVSSARAVLDSIRPGFQFDAVESGGIIRFIARQGRVPVATIGLDELVLTDAGARAWNQTKGQETELPDAIKLSYGDLARDDQPAGTEARRSLGGSQRTIEYSVPLVMPEALATRICQTELHSAWVGRERASFTLAPSRLALDPGDVVDFTPTRRLMRLSDANDATTRQVNAFEVDPRTVSPGAALGSANRKPFVQLFLPATVALVDGPLLDDADDPAAGYIAGTMAPFRHGIATFRSPADSGFTLDGLLPLKATIGVTRYDFYPGPTSRWDRVNTLYVQLSNGALSSASELQVLNGANPLLLQNPAGDWELIQFATATPDGERSYKLSNLLRGQRGTEPAMANPLPAGARVLLADAALRQTGLPAALVGLTLNWSFGPADAAIGGTDFVSGPATMTGRGRRPLSPTRLRGRRDPATGDWALSWIRRTRIGGDNWEQLEVPLGEDSERYHLQILSGETGTVLRALTLDAPAYLYPIVQQTADFGAPSYAFWARVAQISASYGDGAFTEALIWVR